MKAARNLTAIIAGLSFATGLSLLCGCGQETTTAPKGWTASGPFSVEVSKSNGEETKNYQLYENSIGMKFALIPAGEFIMGSDEGFEDERPAHKVKITKSFYISINDVTADNYKQMMGGSPALLRGAFPPVVNVSWNDAVEFCKQLSKNDGKKYNLPTEAQLKYALCAGQYRSAASYGKSVNIWGINNMSSFFWEWCLDIYASDYYGKSPTNNPHGPTTGNERIVIGGCLGCTCGPDYPYYDDHPSRKGLDPSMKYPDVGFRVVVEK